ncbi:MAG: sulfotransferase domain-containing protein [Frankiaceae bacterium]|nr:sulfotransferase domain-containing protein [Frankiaceae bacterium]
MTRFRVPDVVVAGAQKAGTTGLFRSLGAAPGVATPTAQEAMFLHRDQPWNDWCEEYVGEAFPPDHLIAIKLATLIYFPDSIERLRRLNPSAKLLVVLRHPVDRMVSLHQFLTAIGIERRPLADALAADDLMPGSGYRLATYSGGSRYADALQSLSQTVSAGQVLVQSQHDVMTAEGLADVARFVGLPAAIPLVRANESGAPRSAALGRVLQNPRVKAAVRTVIPAERRQRGRTLVRRLNTGSKPATAGLVPPDLRARLLERHAVDVDAAEVALGRALPEWRA